MEQRKLIFQDAPWGYQLCFNSKCPKADECLHYQVGLLAPSTKTKGAAIYPAAWKNGDCPHYRSCQPVQLAWGFTNLYRHLPAQLASAARMHIRAHLSSGMSTYYRYHHGERFLSPKQQEEILDIMKVYGPTDDLRFDHYVTSYDFT